MQKVYNNLDQLSNFDEMYDSNTRLEQQRKSGGTNQELHKISEIYLNKSIQPPLPKNQSAASRPFRPLLRQFEDEPSELNVDTVMDGIRYGATQAKDVSLAMADRVDQIQRSYINQTHQVTRHSAHPAQSTTVMTLPPRPFPLPQSSQGELSDIRLSQTV